MKRILVPTDFSDCATAAAQVAIDIAQKANAEIHFIHFCEPSADVRHVTIRGEVQPSLHHRNKEESKARTALDELVVLAEHQGVRAIPQLVFTKNDEGIEDYIKPLNIDLLVMGSHGASGIRELVIGSTTQHVIRLSPVPVLVVKRRERPFVLNHIVYASDFKTDYIKPFRHILELAKLWSSQIHLLYINTPLNFHETKDVLSDMKRFMQSFKNAAYVSHVYDAIDEERGIHQFTNSHPADLVALTTHGHTGFVKMLTSSLTESLVNHEVVPVLVMNLRLLEEPKEHAEEVAHA